MHRATTLPCCTLSNIIRIVEGWPDLLIDTESLLPVLWALRVIPSITWIGLGSVQTNLNYFLGQFQAEKMPILDPAGFADYLCCINSFLSPVDPRVVVQINKSPFIDSLIIQLLNVLPEAYIDNVAITRIFQTTGQLGKGTPVDNRWWVFLDPDLQPTMRQYPVWSHLGRIALKIGDFRRGAYIDIGANIANSTVWKPIMYQDLSTWIRIWSPNAWGSGGISWPKFTAVICNIWIPDFDKDYKLDNSVNNCLPRY
ncbi:hypothetical protein DFH09DRAFT_1101529 [Mycena vulgaris]|nr:hypothetical protein DFH09DRAFT_1101529 [Mycena vulgaris]